MEKSSRQGVLPNRAILLLGPTGAGKTPLGELMAERGFRESACVHFDFGASLRRVVQEDRPDEQLSRKDLEFLKNVLETGILLEDADFPIAERILRRFLGQRQVAAGTGVVLNGIPRHVGQAKAMESILQIDMVIVLDCDAQTVLRRIENNVGGDRRDRFDDDLSRVQRKLELFWARTSPLVAHYRARGVQIETLEITATMTPDQMWQMLHPDNGDLSENSKARSD
jgi:adenylate kinase family enzyme